MLLAVCISVSSIGLVHVQVYQNTFWFILHVMFGAKNSSDNADKAKINVKKKKAVFYDVMIWFDK